MRQIYKTQLSDATLKEEGGGARVFSAVHGDEGEEGELFGMANMLRYESSLA